jgi:hypothetical protein
MYAGSLCDAQIHSVSGICTVIWALFALVLFLHISLEALTKPKQGSFLRKGCVRLRPHNVNHFFL